MSNARSPDPTLMDQLVLQAADLPDEDLRMVVEFAARLAEARQVEQAAQSEDRRAQARAFLDRAKVTAESMRHKSRAELFAELEDIGERIRAAAIANSTAIDEEIRGD